MTTKAVIALATADTDFGVVPANKAQAEAQALTNEEGKVVTLRDPITDKVLGTVKPAKAGLTARLKGR